MADVKITLLTDKARIPTKMTEGSAGYDLYAAADAVVPAATTSANGTTDIGRCLIPLGIALELPIGTVGRIAGRSGLSTNFNVEVGAGWIDSDFRGQVMVELKNLSSVDFKIMEGDRIAQLVLLTALNAEFVANDNLKVPPEVHLEWAPQVAEEKSEQTTI